MTADIRQWLDELGLGKHVDAFVEAEIDFDVLPHLSDADLKDIGLPIGARKRLLLAVSRLRLEAAPAGADASEAAAAEPERAGRKASREAERRQLTVVFCDLVGSTELSQRLDPEDLREVMRRYQDAVAGAVTRYGGYVAKYLGDGMLAYFGWPQAQEDQAERAVRAGLEAVAAVEGLSFDDGVRLQTRVGVATGTVVIGDLVGEVGRDDEAVLGETPTMAARLQQFAAPNQVVIGQSTRRLISGAFTFEDLGSTELKGFDDRVEIFQVTGEREVESRFDAAQGAALASLVGRQHELGLLRERWELAKAGEGQVVLLSGEAGIGKSRLVQALAEAVAADKHTLLRVQCSPYHTHSALYPVIQRVERAAGFAAGDDAAARLDKIEAMLDDGTSELGEVVPLYASLLSVPFEERYGPLELTPEHFKRRIQQILTERLLNLAKKEPVLYLLEDAHWIDPTTLELLQQLLARSATVPLLMLITHRPDWHSEWASQHGHAVSLSLGKLATPQVVEIVKALAGEKASRDLVEEVVRRTDGIPLFVEELTRSLIESGAEDLGRARDIPETLQASLMARLDRLPAEAKEVAQTGAVIGREFRRDLLAAVSEKPDDKLTEALGQLLGSRLLLQGGGTTEDAFVFRHALIQDAAYQSLLASRRRHLHQAIAEALENDFPEVVDSQPELIARHLSEAGLSERAVPYWRRAGELASGRFANIEAVAHLEQGLALARDLPESTERSRDLLGLRIAIAEGYFRVARYDDAVATYLKASEIARQLGDRGGLARAAMGIAETNYWRGVFDDKSLTLLKEALDELGNVESIDRCRLMSRLGSVLLMGGDLDQAAEINRQAVEAARRVGDKQALIDALGLEGGYLALQIARDPAGAIDRDQVMDEMVSLAEEIGSPDYLMKALNWRIFGHVEVGAMDRFGHSLAKVQELAEKYQVPFYMWSVASFRALSAILHGEFDEGERFAEMALERSQGLQGIDVHGLYGIQMFTIRREQGRLAEVAPVIKRMVDENPDDSTWRPGFAIIASDLGFEEPARKVFDEIAEGGFALPRDAKRNVELSYLAELCARLGDARRAEQLYELLLPCRDIAVTLGLAAVCYGSAGRYLGLLAETMGARELAEEHFAAALKMNEEMRAWPWLAHTQYAYGQMLRRDGESGAAERADALLKEAWETADRLGMVALKQQMRSQYH